MTQLSRLVTLGISARESPSGTYAAPAWAIPFEKCSFSDDFDKIADTSYRGNDTVTQGLYQGPGQSTWDIDTWGYPDILGVWLRAMIGPDTVTSGISTTVATGGSLAGATSIPSTASIPTGTTIQIGTGATQEWAVTGAPSGSGPYTLPITTPATGLVYPHLAAEAVVAQSTHVFKQSPTTTIPSYSLTVYDTLTTTGYSYAKLSDLQVTIDPKAAVKINTKMTAFPGSNQMSATETYNTVQPFLGWQWTMTNAGASSTRGLTLDLTAKRATEAIHASNGSQTPREVFAAAIEIDGTYKAIFESQADLNLYLQYLQQPTTAQLTAPVAKGGYSLALTMSKSGYTKGVRDLASGYVQADFDVSAIFNSTDGGGVQATLTNYISAAY